MSNFNRREIRKLEHFFKKYLKYYSPGIQDFVKSEFDPNEGYLDDFINQIYTYLFPDSYDNLFYRIFSECLKDQFPDLDERKIVEVASGYIPGLAIYLKNSYDIFDHITCYDPKSIPLRVPGIIIKKEEFRDTTSILESDLLIAHCPCEALDSIVRNTINNKIEMCVQTCPCGHESFSYGYFRYYIDSLIDALKVLEDDGFKIDCFDTESFEFTHAPVISVRRREKINK